MPRRRSRFGYDDSAGGGRWSKVMRLLLGTLIACVFASTPVLSEDVYQCQDRRSGVVYWNKFQLEGGRVFPLDLRAFVMKVISDTKRDVIGPGFTEYLTCRTNLLTTVCTTSQGASANAWVFEGDIIYGTIHYSFARIPPPNVLVPTEEVPGGTTAVRNGTCRKLKL